VKAGSYTLPGPGFRIPCRNDKKNLPQKAAKGVPEGRGGQVRKTNHPGAARHTPYQGGEFMPTYAPTFRYSLCQKSPYFLTTVTKVANGTDDWPNITGKTVGILGRLPISITWNGRGLLALCGHLRRRAGTRRGRPVPRAARHQVRRHNEASGVTPPPASR